MVKKYLFNSLSFRVLLVTRRDISKGAKALPRQK